MIVVMDNIFGSRFTMKFLKMPGAALPQSGRIFCASVKTILCEWVVCVEEEDICWLCESRKVGHMIGHVVLVTGYFSSKIDLKED